MTKENTFIYRVGRRIEDYTYKNADRIIVMNSGKIEDIGTHQELLERNAIYREVYTSQNRIGEGNEQ